MYHKNFNFMCNQSLKYLNLKSNSFFFYLNLNLLQIYF